MVGDARAVVHGNNAKLARNKSIIFGPTEVLAEINGIIRLWALSMSNMAKFKLVNRELPPPLGLPLPKCPGDWVAEEEERFYKAAEWELWDAWFDFTSPSLNNQVCTVLRPKALCCNNNLLQRDTTRVSKDDTSLTPFPSLKLILPHGCRSHP